MSCTCFFIPGDVLLRLAGDQELPEEARRSLHRTAEISTLMRNVRDDNNALSSAEINFPLPFPRPPFPWPHPPHILPAAQVYDEHHGSTLPGMQVPNPGSAADLTAKRAYAESESVANFYWTVFGRDSIDGHHMTLVSSIHYGVNFNNAFWNGAQMTYGDGDGSVFLDFTLGDDVIGHELTHGVTQHSLALSYVGEAGGLNESMSDVFGSMFRQWEKGQASAAGDWLIGADIMGPMSHTKGYTCLRDMAAPKAPHALAAQPDHYYPGIGNLDPHYSSGVPNLAFCRAAKTAGGHSWDKVGKVWYAALTTTPPSPNMTMPQWASRTRALATSLYSNDASVHAAIDGAWTSVGL